MQSIQPSQAPSQGAPADGSGDASQQPQVQPNAPQVDRSGHAGQQQPPVQSGGAGGQDQGGMIKFAQILQTLLGSLLGAIPFIGSALSSLTAGIGRSAHNS